MKKNTLLMVALFVATFCFSQKVVIVGINHVSVNSNPSINDPSINDGFSFVATENISAGEIIYFTDNEYDNTTNVFTFNGFASGEAVVIYTVGTGGLNKDVVVFLEETSLNTFTASCSSGNCGTAMVSSNPINSPSFALSTNGEALYAYADNNDDVTDGITDIYSVLYTGSGEAPSQNGGAIPAVQNPVVDFPNALVIDGFPDDIDDFVGLDRVEYMFDPATLREDVTRGDFQNIANWLHAQPNAGLSVVAFSNMDVALPVDDDDGDGFTSDVDCDDNDDTVYPGAPELCDGKDNDCNTSVDDGLTFVSYYPDFDGDGFGDESDTGDSLCEDPVDGRVTDNTDCNDGDADINPGATEVFDGVDNNCDGNVDEGFTNAAIWNGAINSDWTNLDNWDTNAPGLTPSDDVTIPSGLTNYPVLTSGQDLSLANGLSLTIASGASLSISPAVVITNNGTVIVDGSMTLQSDAAGSAYIGSGSGTFTGDVTVERYISARRAYRQLSTPVTTSNFISNNWQQGSHITGSTAGANGFDATGSGNPSMYTFDNVAYNYVPMANTDATNLMTGQGYHMLVRGDRTTDLTNNNATPSETTLSATGTLVSENAGTSTVNVTVPEQRFVFVGNPFQAPVDMNKVITTDATNINSTYYWVWDPTLGTRGAYAAVFAATGSTAVSDANQYLQAGQAGWVYTAAAGATQLSFTQASKNTSVSETAVFKTTAKKASTGELRLSLYETSALAANQSAVDGILVLFDDAGNNAVDGSDAPKFTNLDETFSTSNNGTLLAIESRATPVDTDEITLSITTYRDNNYTIVAEGTAVQGEAPYLFDAYADVYTEIPQNGTVNYAYSIDDNIPASMDAERFTVVFGQQALTVSNLDIERIMLYPNPSNTGQFYLNIPQQIDDLEVTIYNALGAKLFYKTGFTAGQNVSIKTSFTRNQGLYFVNLTSKGATTTKKLIIN
ncbi:MopE-related protein [Algibacter sp.]|nr:MopE-related protein [Algibacter sp.]